MNKRRFEEFLESGLPQLEYAEHVHHPREEILEGYVYGQLGGEAVSRVSAHIATCLACHETVQHLRGEMEAADVSLADLLADPAGVGTKAPIEAEERASVFESVVKSIENGIEKLVPQRRFIAAHAAAYAIVAALLVGMTALLDRLLIPPASPLASPVRVTRWWTYLYWVLLPWGLFLLARIVVGVVRRKGKRNHEED